MAIKYKSKLVPLLYNDPKFFYYSGNDNGSGLGNFVQTSYKYGHDRQGNSDSNQPYITTDIPDRLFTSPTDDGFIRGGWVTANRAANNDKERINKFFNDKPKGPLFIQRQIGLQLTNPKIETRKINLNGFGLLGNLITAGYNAINDVLPGPTRLYNEGKNTLSQIPSTAFGDHFERHGLSPVQDDNTKYLAVVYNNNQNGNNRLLSLKKKLIKPNIAPNKNVVLGTINAILGAVNVFNTIIGKGTNPLLPNSPILSPQDYIIDQYSGGPGSRYGVGLTTIRRYDVTSNGYNKPTPEKGKIDYTALGVSNQYLDPASADNNFTVNHITVQNPTNKPSQIDQTVVDYGKGTYPAGAYPSSDSPTTRMYDSVREATDKLKTEVKQDEITVKGSTNIELNRTSPIYQYYGGKKTIDLTAFARTEKYQDENILSLTFGIINPFDPDPTAKPDTISLSAYMKGFRDNFDGTWNEYNYVGRSESFYTYGKFKRNIGFSLDIPCFNKADLLKNYEKLGKLASTTAGSYNDNGLLGGVIIRLNIGKHVNGDYGLLTNLSYEIPDDSSWDIDTKLAMYIKATFSFNIVHANLPAYNTAGQKFLNYV